MDADRGDANACEIRVGRLHRSIGIASLVPLLNGEQDIS